MTELSAKLPISEQQVFGMSGLGMEWWQGKRVLITGHSGFKGSWLSIWLNRLGAQVFGLSLKPKFKDDLFLVANVASLCEKSVFGDILDFELVRNIVGECQPDVVFHMAAQPLVRESYNNPRETFNTNVIGTVNLLDALKNVGKKVAVVVVTTDKVYRNTSEGLAFTESDILGGDDPYSASKAGAELVVDSYRASFFKGTSVRVASARAGNVIGGGDWSDDRLLPDCFRALRDRKALVVRNPTFTRPWQHVLDPLHGYMVLAESMSLEAKLQAAYNFGPEASIGETVYNIIERVKELVPSLQVHTEVDELAPKEATFLSLDTTFAHQNLGVSSKWDLDETIIRTSNWYLNYLDGAEPYELCLDDIARFELS